MLVKRKPNPTCTSYNPSHRFQTITYFNITYYHLPNMRLHHLQRKRQLPTYTASRSISAQKDTQCQRATLRPQWPAEGSSPGYSWAPPTPSSSAQCLHTEAASWFPPIPSTGPGGSPVPSWAQRQSLDHLRLCFWQGSGLQGPVCILFWSSHILPWRKSWKCLLVTGINITSVLYSHNCAASPIPPPDPICQTSFLLDLISFWDPDIQLDLDWKGYILVKTWAGAAGFFTEIINNYV